LENHDRRDVVFRPRLGEVEGNQILGCGALSK
jgi:hypothetical protein